MTPHPAVPMLVDARHLEENARLAADLCIVGAGPAGLTIARELAGLRIDVLQLESGGLDSEVSAQDLDEGSLEGDAYAGLRSTRHRGVGGTVRLWNTPVRGEPGAKYVPLDDADFLARPGVPHSGWPFDRPGLLPFYERAQRICAIGPFDYDVGGEHESRRSPEFAGGNLVARIYQLGRGHAFTGTNNATGSGRNPRSNPDTNRAANPGTNLSIVADADNVRLCHHTTVTALRTSGRRVTSLDAVDSNGRPFRVEARATVLAGGAIENARLLLASPDSPWADNEWVGRCFMEHPRDYSMTLQPVSPDLARDFGFFDTHEIRSPQGAGGKRLSAHAGPETASREQPAVAHDDPPIVAGRIALTSAAILDGPLPNASVTLLPRLRASPARGAIARVRDALRARAHSRATEGYGWSETPDPAALYDAFRLILNVEQWPHPENRITLGAGRDRSGLPRAVLHWRWRESDEHALERVRSLIANDIEDSGLGAIRRGTAPGIDPNAHHHAGTTRMHADPRYGVVDADGRVHGTDNLFVSGASLFPTAGFANPTLTIVALAIRLADRLATL